MAQLLAGMLFFALGFDRQVIRVLAKSLEWVPSGAYPRHGAAVEGSIARLGVGHLFHRACSSPSRCSLC